MTVSKVAPIRFHEDPAYFREAVNFTAAATGFPSRMKGAVERIGRELAGFRVTTPMKRANNSTQYIAGLGYRSLVGPQEETIKIEVGLREPLLTPSLQAEVRTLLLDPVNELPLVPLPSVECLSWEEAMAEKFRAALSRRDVAVRDFYDIDHVVHRLGFPVLGPGFVELVREKLAVPGNESIDVSAGRLNNLRLQVDPSWIQSVNRATSATIDKGTKAFSPALTASPNADSTPPIASI